jgi:phage tail P2-like protein
MTNSLTLLPPKTTALQRAIALACAPLGDIPVPIRKLMNPDECPVAFLPHLAWAFSVDRWDDTWPESTKRAAIKASYFIHRHKGTVAAVRRVTETVGRLVNLTEWWQTEPKGPRGTFSLEISVSEAGISEHMFLEMERLIEDAKPKSRHISNLEISLHTTLNAYFAVAVCDGDYLDTYPWKNKDIDVIITSHSAIREHCIDSMEIYPHD